MPLDVTFERVQIAKGKRLDEVTRAVAEALVRIRWLGERGEALSGATGSSIWVGPTWYFLERDGEEWTVAGQGWGSRLDRFLPPPREAAGAEAFRLRFVGGDVVIEEIKEDVGSARELQTSVESMHSGKVARGARQELVRWIVAGLGLLVAVAGALLLIAGQRRRAARATQE